MNLGQPTTQPVSLAEVFALIEADTDLRFTLADEYFPLGTEVSLVDSGTVPLTRLLEEISRQTPLRFERKDRQMLVHVVKAGANPASAQRIEPAAPALHTEPAVASVRQIAGDRRLSQARKEKQIFQVVREAVLGAAADVTDDREFLDVILQLAGRAASAGPQYTEAIANAIAFAPPVAAIKGARGLIRSAAYSKAGSPAQRNLPVATDRASDSASSVSGPRAARPWEPIAQADEPRPPEIRGMPASSLEVAPTFRDTAAAESGSVAATQNVFTPGLAGLVLNPISDTPASVQDTSGIVQMEAFGVRDTVVQGGSAALRSERARATVALDYMSADQLAKFGAADLSDVVFRIPGVSVANGQFAVIRGLSDRFLSTTLQGMKVPSPDPEKQAVQLDLIPASAVEAVVVSKTFDPSQWAESSGGNMDVRTRAIPGESMLKISFGLKLNSNAANGGPDYAIRGSLNERFGFGSRSRLAPGTVDPSWQYVPTRRSSFPVGNKFSIEYARPFSIGGQKLGLLVSAFNEASYRSKSGRKSTRLAFRGEAPRAATANRPATKGLPSDFEKEPRLPSSQGTIYLFEESETDFVSGLTLGLGYSVSDNHELKLSGIFVQSGSDQTQINETELSEDSATGLLKTVGPAPNQNADPIFSWFRTYEYFRERNLTVLQLAGRHTFPALGGLSTRWAAQHGKSYQKDHPFIESVFVTPLANLYKTYISLQGSDAPTPIFAVWGDNRETQKAGRLDFEWPWQFFGNAEAKFSFGAALDQSEREVTGVGSISTQQRPLSGPNPNEIVAQAAKTVGGLFYSGTSASREIRAYHAGLSLPVLSWAKVVGGARFEDFSLAVSGVGRWGNFSTTTFYDNRVGGGQFGQILGTTATNNPAFASEKWYPAMGLVIDPFKSMTIRLSQSSTNGRPSFREVSPFFNKSIESGNLVVGNPALIPSEVESRDLRIEWAPSRDDFVSFSVFQKEIENPIEKILLDTRASTGESTETWVNNRGEAELRGFEFEFRHRLGRWSEALRALSVSGNITSIRAEVTENPIVVNAATPSFQDPLKIARTRRLFDQPKYIGNLELTWANSRIGTSATFSAFAISDTLKVAGLSSFGFDLYERAHVRYDFIFNQQLTARLKLKLSVKNLTDSLRGTIYDRDATSELLVHHEYRVGREYGLSLTADF